MTKTLYIPIVGLFVASAFANDVGVDIPPTADAERKRITSYQQLSADEKARINERLRQAFIKSPYSLAKRKALITDGVLYEGMLRENAMQVLGEPTDETQEYIEWYYNPGHRGHVGAYFRCRKSGNLCYDWETGNK